MTVVAVVIVSTCPLELLGSAIVVEGRFGLSESEAAAEGGTEVSDNFGNSDMDSLEIGSLSFILETAPLTKDFLPGDTPELAVIAAALSCEIVSPRCLGLVGFSPPSAHSASDTPAHPAPGVESSGVSALLLFDLTASNKLELACVVTGAGFSGLAASFVASFGTFFKLLTLS